MSDREICRVCGEKRPADAPSGLCPACLLKAGLVANGSERDEVTLLFGPASSSVLAAFGEEFGKIPPVLLRDADSASEPGPVIRPSSAEIPGPGQRTARLQLFGEIARGGMGAVLKGRDADLGRDLAVKILLESHRHKPEMIRRFIEEAQIAGQLQHPGIVPVYELGAFGDRRPYFAMKLVKGHTLAEILANRKSLSEGLPRLLSIFESICQTMAYAHARGVIHRDLKPSNVMVGSFGEVQVMDWGLAKVLPRGGTVEDASAGHTKDQGTVIATARSASDSDMSQAGSIMGTPSYMAPEQARGEIDEVDERADVFALGSIFCELLTGQPAFTGRNSGEIQRKAARGELAEALARLDQNNLGHDPELITLAKSCLAPERDDRPRHAGEIAERMSLYHSRVQERLRQSEIERAAEKARAEEATKRVAVERQRMRLTVALAASILGFIILGGSGWAYVAQQRATRQAATERVVTEAVDKATLLRGQAKAAPIDDLSKWSEALAAANEARSSMETGEPTVALRERVDELLATLQREQADATRRADELAKDKKLFDLLDAVRVQSVDQKVLEKTNEEYAQAFRDFGIDVDQLEPEAAAHLFRRRESPQEFASRLDDWTLIRKEAVGAQRSEPWKRLVSIAMKVDEDPWRNSLRSLIGNQDGEAIRRLASDESEMSKQTARSLYLLAQVLESTRDDTYHEHYLKESIDILKRAWRLSPNDYQISRTLGANSERELDRIRFSTAAVAAAPDSSYRRRGLAEALLPSGALGNFLGRGTNTMWIKNSNETHIKDDPDAWLYPRLAFTSEDGQTTLMGPLPSCDMRSVNEDNLNDAVAELQFATRLAPDSIYFHMSLAIALVLQGRLDDAIRESQIIRRIDSKYSQGDELGKTLYFKGELDRASQVVREDIERDPGGNHYYALLGYIYHEQGKKELAFAAYREAFMRSEPMPMMEELMEATGSAEAVTAVYRDAIQADPEDIHLRLRFAKMAERRGKADASIAIYRDAVKAHPESVELHEGLAKLLDRQGKTAEANAEVDRMIDLLREQLRSKPEAIPLYQSLAKMVERRGKADESIAIYREAIKAHPKSVEIHEGFADLLERQGMIAESNAELDQVIDLLQEQLRSKENWQILQHLGTAYLWRGQRKEANDQFRRIIELDPMASGAFNAIAWDLATNHNPKRRDGTIAVEFATKACELTEWKESTYLDTLAAACAESGDFEAAVKWQTNAIELESNEKNKEDYGKRLTLYLEKKPFHSASSPD